MPSSRAIGMRWTALAEQRPRLAAVLPGLVLLVLGLVVFWVILDSVQEQDDLMLVDAPVLDWLVANRDRVGTTVLYTITLVSGPGVLPFVIGAAAVGWGMRTHAWWRPMMLVAAMVGSTAISLLIKQSVARPRPPLDSQYVPGAETTFSFPSGHTIGTATLCLVAGYLIWSRRPSKNLLVVWFAVSFVVTTAVGLSRLYLGYHFVTDVLAAVALAIAVLGVVVAVDRLHELTRGAAPSPVEQAPR
jgi:membrane-associated phospholipid phosphatase